MFMEESMKKVLKWLTTFCRPLIVWHSAPGLVEDQQSIDSWFSFTGTLKHPWLSMLTRSMHFPLIPNECLNRPGQEF